MCSLADLAMIERIMQLMILVSDRYGKLVVVDRQLAPHQWALYLYLATEI